MGQYWTELEEYVRKGGLLVLSTFDIDGSNSEPTTLWDTLGVRWVSDMGTPEPVYRWVPSHAIFTFPNTVGDLTFYIQGYYDSGDHVAATTGTPIAGFTPSSTEDYAAVVVGNTYPTVLFSFRPDEFRYDQDRDGKLDAIELWENAITYLARGFEHDLAVSSEAPKFLGCGESTLLNATVSNRGLSNETNVELQLLINGTVFDSVLISELPTGASYTLRHLWTPRTAFVNYNVTAYASPVLGEDFISNNRATKMVYVSFYTRTYLQPQWIGGGVPMGWHADDASWSYTLPFDFPFYGVYYRTIYISSNGLITFLNPDSSYGNSIQALAGKLAMAPAWEDWVTYDPYDIYICQNSTHVGIRWYVRAYGSGFVANFEAILSIDGVIQCNYGYNDGPVSPTIGISNAGAGDIIAEDVGSLNYINSIAFIPFRPEHELVIYLDAPACLELDHSALLNATLENRGSNNETNVELYLLTNGTTVSSATIPELLVRGSYVLTYLWTPTLEATYNVTAYAPPVLDENFTANNIATKLVKVRPIKGYILFDQTHGTDNIAYYSIWVANLTERGYVIETHTSGPITSTILKMYEVFVIPQAYFDYTSDELSAIQNFVLNGGGLLVIGDDSPWIYTSVTSFAGITWTSGGVGGYTSDITPHPVTDRVTTAYFGAPASYLQVASPAIDLIRDQYRYIMLAVSEIGTGKVLGIADEQSIDDSDIGYADNVWLANDMIDWMSLLYEHDVAIVSVVPSAYQVMAGETGDVKVTVENQGNFTENFTVTAYASSMNSTRIYLDPSNYTFDTAAVSIGYRFNVTVKVEDVADLGAWQVCMYHNDGIINVTRWFEPTWDPEYVFYGMATVSGEYLEPTFFMGFAVLYGPAVSYIGIGKLCIIEFEIMAIPPIGGKLSCTLEIDNRYTTLSNEEEIPAVKQNGYYELAWGGPPPPPPLGVYKIGTITVANLVPGARITLTFTWNTTGVLPKDYRIWAEASMVPGETDKADNTHIDGIIRVMKPPIASLTYSPPFPKPGETVIFNASASTPDGGTIVSYHWDFGDGNITATTDPIITHTYAFSGLYNVTLTIIDSEGLTDSTWKTIYVFTRDIAIVDVTPSTDQIYIGRTISINVTILNEGEVTETFNVILYYNITAGDIIGTQTVMNLLPGEHRTLTFIWNTTGVKPCYNYRITAYAIPVVGETDIADNTMSSSTLVKVKLLGDINGDGKVDIFDVRSIALCFGSYPGDPKWNPDYDLNQSGGIDMFDIRLAAKNFGKCAI
jgi:hypothetical protein